MLHAHTYDTPAGPLSVIVDPDPGPGVGCPDGAVVAAGFCRPQELLARLAALGDGTEPDWAEVDRLALTDKAVAAYLAGDPGALDGVPVAQPGTALQQEVWDGLRSVPSGSTVTYTELAARTSRPRAVRAAGTACGRNLIAPFVPCHRALRSDGSLGGYLYGLDVKRWLLAHEASAAASPLTA